MLIEPVALSNLQSLVQLSVALNGAYFTFRSSNEPIYKEMSADFQSLSTYFTENDLSKDQRLNSKFIKLFEEFQSQNFMWKIYHNIYDGKITYIGYALAMAGIILLFIFSVMPNSTFSYEESLLTFLSLYSLLIVSVGIEIAFNASCAAQRSRIEQLNSEFATYMGRPT